ncbi:hypothetical protein K2173_024378 [Erythroxylum novogranatense]|uniref:Zinc finger CCCH domain-containing protein 62-like n=1 Tax=Erythroxylum novogranatense TaxID=1862640 RepID=A0AAV8SUE2_9ROSI|nr:hypothetical protein K2173_024378 [Erythroxylum novogranatense]
MKAAKNNPAMGISEPKPHRDDEEDYMETDGSDSDYDSDMDPSYSIIEETGNKLSNLSIKKKSTPRAKNLDLGMEKDLEQADDDDDEEEESFLEVQNFIEAGKIEKLKVCQCKAYLKRNGLRLTGNKGILIERIKEHQQLLKCGGEEKYPVSSFVLNCKGDACKGDVVLFEQNVYEMYNIAARSAGGPPCGKRLVAGRIVKESYGAAKQQHTFTIEVLWSKGKMSLPPLHPLLIKGRNLYRMGTQRQMWENEDERCKVLMEKHSRGSIARSDRETRIQEIEKKKLLRELRAEGKKDPESSLSHLIGSQGVQIHQSRSALDVQQTVVQPQKSHISINVGTTFSQSRLSGVSVESGNIGVKLNNHEVQKHSAGSVNNGSFAFHERCRGWQNGISGFHHPGNHPLHKQPLTVQNQPPLRSLNHHHLANLPHRQSYQKLQLCRYYARGRCYYGDNCKFIHESGDAHSLKREERW